MVSNQSKKCIFIIYTFLLPKILKPTLLLQCFERIIGNENYISNNHFYKERSCCLNTQCHFNLLQKEHIIEREKIIINKTTKICN